MQTLPIEFAVPVKEKEEKKSVLIPELKKEMSPELKKEMSPVPQMIVRSELKRENAVLTDSIEMMVYNLHSICKKRSYRDLNSDY